MTTLKEFVSFILSDFVLYHSFVLSFNPLGFDMVRGGGNDFMRPNSIQRVLNDFSSCSFFAPLGVPSPTLAQISAFISGTSDLTPAPLLCHFGHSPHVFS